MARTFSTSGHHLDVHNWPKHVVIFPGLLKMCFARQRHALVRHLNFQRWSDPGVLCTCSLPNLLRATGCTVPNLNFQTCFAPQRWPLFRHLILSKCTEAEVLCTFSLPNVLRATTVCNFSSFIWRAGSAPAALASLLRDPPEPQIMRKHSVSRLSYFSHTCIVPRSDLLHVRASAELLCFSICQYCRKFSFQTSFDEDIP